MINFEDYQKNELTIHPGKAQIFGILYGLPFILCFVVAYYFIWGASSFQNPFKYFDKILGKLSLFVMLGFMLIGIILHELIHGITWSKFSSAGLKSIKFGVVWKYVTPYCHCKEPLFSMHYIIGALMPAIILGFLASILAICTNNFGLFLFGLFLTLAAGGDFMIINLLRKKPMTNLV